MAAGRSIYCRRGSGPIELVFEVRIAEKVLIQVCRTIRLFFHSISANRPSQRSRLESKLLNCARWTQIYTWSSYPGHFECVASIGEVWKRAKVLDSTYSHLLAGLTYAVPAQAEPLLLNSNFEEGHVAVFRRRSLWGWKDRVTKLSSKTQAETLSAPTAATAARTNNSACCF